ncbi:hypothetical protein BE21_55910 [Sorangium cellulosum]|uniref:Uncharacterized protein n=1 Tax=Sorangium cellulosum TaxID=56 RepID=A0A150TAV3_SORCE|nr:hypothetical protein BE21_55910 [Sorangium cellulosum]
MSRGIGGAQRDLLATLAEHPAGLPPRRFCRLHPRLSADRFERSLLVASLKVATRLVRQWLEMHFKSILIFESMESCAPRSRRLRR